MNFDEKHISEKHNPLTYLKPDNLTAKLKWRDINDLI